MYAGAKMVVQDGNTRKRINLNIDPKFLSDFMIIHAYAI